ncbi:uncharacterized protein LOC119642961 [Glossina fuscipes]|uniref:Uncharacterized protein LOC119642961 n=1 Tax=Glossina fuscipes TaxID=7396 RepID=A0A9C5ZLC0_9MUSC|nr:uncharacterized protein LOC119642961 [Glossina fuscipes]
MEVLTLQEQQQFNVKSVTKNRRHAFVKKRGFDKYNAVAGKGEGDDVEQAKNNNSDIGAKRRSRRSGYERRQRNVKSVNVSKDGGSANSSNHFRLLYKSLLTIQTVRLIPISPVL